jgi:hypothetical protein
MRALLCWILRNQALNFGAQCLGLRDRLGQRAGALLASKRHPFKLTATMI